MARHVIAKIPLIQNQGPHNCRNKIERRVLDTAADTVTMLTSYNIHIVKTCKQKNYNTTNDNFKQISAYRCNKKGMCRSRNSQGINSKYRTKEYLENCCSTHFRNFNFLLFLCQRVHFSRVSWSGIHLNNPALTFRNFLLCTNLSFIWLLYVMHFQTVCMRLQGFLVPTLRPLAVNGCIVQSQLVEE